MTDDLLVNNRAFAARYVRGHLDVHPSLHLAIVTCMTHDSMSSPRSVSRTATHILRNTGGAITDDVIRLLSISQA